MAQGQRLSDWQIETIRLAFAETGNMSHAARKAGCAFNTAKKYIVDHLDELTKLRNEKRGDVVAQVAELRVRVIEEMFTTTRLGKASLSELGILFGILTDKHQLLTGEATDRHEHRNTTEARDTLARRIDELAERRRARGADGVTVGAGSS